MFPEPLIAFRHVRKRFPGVVALDDVSFDVPPGELHAIVGENGAGKSTLMKCLCGMVADYEGELLLRGRPARLHGTAEAQRAGVAIIHQELNLVEELSVAANMFLGREKQRGLGLLDDRGMEREAARFLEELQCDIPPRRLVRQLRIGDQQLVEIAKALSLGSEILLMDEPTSALSEGEAARLFRVIGRLQKRGATILYISHKLDEVFRLADRITVLRDGRWVTTLARTQTSPREISQRMVGRDIERIDPGRPRTLGAPVLEVRGLSLPWPGHARKWRLKDIHFALHRGEILGLAGLLGAGRSELLECLFGAHHALTRATQSAQGELLLEGRKIRLRNPRDALRLGIALVSEDRKRLGIFANLNVAENISIGALPQLTKLGLISSRRQYATVQRSVAELGIKTAGLRAPITSLSGGNQQKALIARGLLRRPQVLLLDDPTRGIDVGAKAELYRLIDRLCREGMGIIVTSSELPELLALCDRILVLCEGRQTGELSRGEATEQRIMELATQRPVGEVA